MALLDRHRLDELGGRLQTVIDCVEGGGATLRDDLTILGVDDRAARQTRAAKEPDHTETRPGASDGAGMIAHIRVPSAPDRLKLVRAVVENATRLAGFNDVDINDVVLAVDESLQNVIRHADGGHYDGLMEVSLSRKGDILIIDIMDEAGPVDVSKIKPRDLDDVRPGGLGTHLINELMDSVDFLPAKEHGGNILRLTKKNRLKQ